MDGERRMGRKFGVPPITYFLVKVNYSFVVRRGNWSELSSLFGRESLWIAGGLL